MNGLFDNLKTTFNEFRIKSENESSLTLESFLPWHKNFALIFALLFLFPVEGAYIFRKGFIGIPLVLYIVYIFPYLIIVYALLRKKIIIFDKRSNKVTERTTPVGGSKNIDFSQIAGIRIEQDKKLNDAGEKIEYVRCYKIHLIFADKAKKYYIDTFENRDEAHAFAQKIAFLTNKPVDEKDYSVEPKSVKKIGIAALAVLSFLIIAKYFLDSRNLEGLLVFVVLIILFIIIKIYLDGQKRIN